MSLKVPAALITFAWDAAVQADIAAAGKQSQSLLKPQLLEAIGTLSWAQTSTLPATSISPLAQPGGTCPVNSDKCIFVNSNRS